MPLGVQLSYNIHPVLKISEYSIDELSELIEEQIKNSILVQ